MLLPTIVASLLIAHLAPPPGALPPADRMTPNPPGAPGLLRRGADALPQSRVRVPVLREGTMLASVRGFFARSLAEPGLLVFTLDDGFMGGMRRTLLVMPCDPADEVRAILEDTAHDHPTYFEVTGTVYDFHGRAFLLPSMIIPLRPPAPPAYLARATPQELVAQAPAEGARAPLVAAYEPDAATALAATPVRDPAPDRMAHEPDASVFPGIDDGLADALERRLDAGIASSRTGTAARPALPTYDRTMMLSPATRLQERRAIVSRDPLTGVWRARLDTGRQGMGGADAAELSMDLLPCKALERMERIVREQPVGTAWLLSGEVVVSKDRNALLLTRAVPQSAHRHLSP
ncbi:MAG: hypothetical protein U0625_02715 [Phycisphaerales bacterium]